MSLKYGSETFTITSRPTILKLLLEPSRGSTRRHSYSELSPGIGYRYEPEQSREVRILLYEHYRITYLIKADGNIDILGVFHGALDIDGYFI